MTGQTVSALLRTPGAIAARCIGQRNLQPLAMVSIAAIAFGGAVFGATVGGYRGGLQSLYSAFKVPAACLWTLALCAPGYYALVNVFGRPFSMRTVVALTLSSIARASLVLLATVPLLWLVIDAGASYHATALWSAVAYGASGLAAAGVFLRALGKGAHRQLLAGLMVGLFCIVGGQSAWMLRPYLGRPSQSDVPFLRAPDGFFAERVWTSGRSAAGLYDRAPARADADDSEAGPRAAEQEDLCGEEAP